ncbi:MAG TPA: hypothetical protein VM802_07995 [Chitinophaga sp.]|uniref:hypothetical protein n=1 Tax=Chitinophaga sp. TaxID=1869181 RepID=UPI002C63C6C5|nr:hypothetical protein [Chitinophaga sp.]HVI44796.1 hypothetical protein [Chitinophaga sp.]
MRSWGLSQRVDDFSENISYDGNGNILSYFRNGTRDTSLAMDDLSYFYLRDEAGRLIGNTLRHVHDKVGSSVYQSDLDDMSDNNYGYDRSGYLTYDAAAGISYINWSIY